jgi:hypothetical protein
MAGERLQFVQGDTPGTIRSSYRSAKIVCQCHQERPKHQHYRPEHKRGGGK